MHFESGAKLIRLLTWTCSTELQNFKESCLDWRLSPLTGPPTVWCYCNKIEQFQIFIRKENINQFWYIHHFWYTIFFLFLSRLLLPFQKHLKNWNQNRWFFLGYVLAFLVLLIYYFFFMSGWGRLHIWPYMKYFGISIHLFIYIYIFMLYLTS